MGRFWRGGGGERMSLRLTSASSGLWSEVRRVLGLGYLPESLLPVTLHHIRTAPTAREGKYTFFQKMCILEQYPAGPPGGNETPLRIDRGPLPSKEVRRKSEALLGWEVHGYLGVTLLFHAFAVLRHTVVTRLALT